MPHLDGKRMLFGLDLEEGKEKMFGVAELAEEDGEGGAKKAKKGEEKVRADKYDETTHCNKFVASSASRAIKRGHCAATKIVQRNHQPRALLATILTHTFSPLPLVALLVAGGSL